MSAPSPDTTAGPPAPTARGESPAVGAFGGDPAVEAFVAAIEPEAFREIAGRVRRRLAEAAPALREQMRYGLPMWTGHGHVASLSPSKTGIAVGFPYGAAFDDPDRRLRGAGKHGRHLRLRAWRDADADVLRGFLAQAIARDAGHGGDSVM